MHAAISGRLQIKNATVDNNEKSNFYIHMSVNLGE